MIRSNVVTGVMSFAEMENMMYKIEGEDLYLIGTSEHSMIGKFIDTILEESELPQTLTSYSPCFRKEVGAHGIEERGVYRIHQFEKQEMVVVCHPDEGAQWFVKLWQNTVDFFRSLDIPVRTLECCSGDLADLKVKSLDVEAWSPRQKKYFEVGSCSNLGDAQARRLGIRVRNKEKGNYFAHTLNNTVVAPPVCSSPSWRTTSRPTAASASPNPFGCIWAAKSLSNSISKRASPRGKASSLLCQPLHSNTPWKEPSLPKGCCCILGQRLGADVGAELLLGSRSSRRA